MKSILSIIVILALLILGFILLRSNREFNIQGGGDDAALNESASSPLASSNGTASSAGAREIMVIGGVKYFIPPDEILSGGPGKDGIPSIDDPKFISAKEAEAFLEDSDPGIGITLGKESRFYPYRILVWHEIVNDEIAGKPVLVTYCPLCATGIVFERLVDGKPEEFGVSGKLWQSNLLMYNRSSDAKNESLWSQVLGEAVVGVHTGKKLSIVPSDIVRWEEWKKLHPDTKALSMQTGASRDYTRDPYGDYYTSESVSFGANFRDTRLHPKARIAGIELDGKFKAYHLDALNIGGNRDIFAGKEIEIEKDAAGRISFNTSGKRLSHIPSFWFSWLAVHPETELFN